MNLAVMRNKTLILDLDETLVHSSFTPIPNPDITLPIQVETMVYNVYILIRPGVKYFLKEMSRIFNIVLYTASLSKYADPLVDILDPNKHCKTRLFREHCTICNNIFVKDLIFLGTNLKDTIIIDNSPNSYAFQVENAIPITSWYNDKNDTALYTLATILSKMSKVDDVRPSISKITTGFSTSIFEASKLKVSSIICKLDNEVSKDVNFSSGSSFDIKNSANTPKENFYFKDNPFNGLSESQEKTNNTIDNSNVAHNSKLL